MHAYNLTMIIKWHVCETKLSIIVKYYNKLDRSKNIYTRDSMFPNLHSGIM